MATIRAKDEIIRLDHPEVLVIEDGPGHRVDRGAAVPLPQEALQAFADAVLV